MQPKLYKTYYDVSKVTIWGDHDPDSETNKPRLVFSFRDGMPRMTVYTGVVGPNGVINAPSDYFNFMVFLDRLEEVANSKAGEVSYEVDNMNLKWENDKPTNVKMTNSTMYIGKSKEGLVYISIISDNKPKIVFTIKNSDFHSWRDKEKNTVPQSVLSSIITKGIISMMRNILSRIVVDWTNEEYDSGARKVGVIKSYNTPTKEKASTIIEDFDSDITF